MKVTLKEVIQSDLWIITKIKQGYNSKVRIDAKRRFHVAEKSDFFSEWGSIKYINQLRAEIGKTPLQITEY